VTADLGSSQNAIFSLSHVPDGTIYAASYSGADSANILKFSPSGQLDKSFAKNGVASTDLHVVLAPDCSSDQYGDR